MALVSKIDSNATGLRYAEEASVGVLPGFVGDPPTDNTATWTPLEPNSYADFGGELTLLARNPINDSRQRKKGVITDLDASGGFQMDLTQVNIQDILQGFMFADIREKNGTQPTTVIVTSGEYQMADTVDLVVGSIVIMTGFTNAENNGTFNVTALDPDVSITVDTTTAAETPPAGAKVVAVGFTAVADDVDVVETTGSVLAHYLFAAGVPTTFGLIPGEFIFVGGDNAGVTAFANLENNGFKRVKTTTATTITIDKSDADMSNETLGSSTIKFFFGRVLKNELAALIKRRTYQLERTLGAPDDSNPTEIQAEYLIGSIPNELKFNIAQADKVTMDLSFVSSDHETVVGGVTLRSDHAAASKPALVESDAFNTSSDFSRINLAVYDVTTPDEAPTKLFVYMTSLTLNISNNVTQNKAISFLGSFDSTAGMFVVNGEIEAYFADVAGPAAVRANSDVTLDFAMAKDNKGIVIDLPLIALGNARLNVTQDQAIKLPLANEAATGALYDPNMDHTIMFVFFDLLPDLAQ